MHYAVLTASDRASSGAYDDRSGPAVVAFVADREPEWEPFTAVVPDDADRIAAALTDLIDTHGCRLAVVTGGTGPTRRDVTPEAVEPLLDKSLPGFGEKMRAASWDAVPTAILARQVAGVRGGCLILTLPGNPKAVPECLDAVWGAVPHCLKLIAAPDVSRHLGGDGSRGVSPNNRAASTAQ